MGKRAVSITRGIIRITPKADKITDPIPAKPGPVPTVGLVDSRPQSNANDAKTYAGSK
jgi:hypothetical protein